MKDIFANLYNKVLSFFNKTDEDQKENAKDVACNRLKLVLMQDRTNLSPAIMDRMRKELIDLLSKYLELDRELLDLSFEHEEEQMALMLSIPVLRAKSEEEIQAILDEEDKANSEDEDVDSDDSEENDSEEDSEDVEDTQEDDDSVDEDAKKEKFFSEKKSSKKNKSGGKSGGKSEGKSEGKLDGKSEDESENESDVTDDEQENKSEDKSEV